MLSLASLDVSIITGKEVVEIIILVFEKLMIWEVAGGFIVKKAKVKISYLIED